MANTKLTKVSRDVKKQKGFINPGIYKGSTMIFETFEDYINECETNNLHKRMRPLFESMSDTIEKQNNLIFSS